MLKKGTPVTIKNTTLTGSVVKAEIVNDDQMSYVVDYKDNDGNAQTRSFTEDQLVVKGVK